MIQQVDTILGLSYQSIRTVQMEKTIYIIIGKRTENPSLFYLKKKIFFFLNGLRAEDPTSDTIKKKFLTVTSQKRDGQGGIFLYIINN